MALHHAGVFVGLAAGLLAGLAFIMSLFKKKVLDMHFDERQERARGKAFQYGFFTMIISTYFYAVSDIMLGHWCDTMVGVSLCIALAICVFAITCILKDAYLSLREKPRTLMTFMFHISPGLTENGVLTYRAVNPIMGTATLVILIVYIVNYLLRLREEEE